MKEDVNHFLRISDLGYKRLVPIIPPGAKLNPKSTLAKRLEHGDDARGKAPGRYDRRYDHWSGYDWTKNEITEISKWHDWGAGIGIKTGRGLVLIDADTLNVEHARTIRDTIERRCGSLPPVRVGRYPKAGYLVRTDPDFAYARVEFGERDGKGRLKDRVEILAEGRQFVAHGIHPHTMKPYRWPHGMPRKDELPFIAGADLLALLEELRGVLPAASDLRREGSGNAADVDQATLRGDPVLVEKAVRATPNRSADFPSRESYVQYGYAIKAALPDDEDLAKELYLDWCARWEDGENDPDIAAAEMDRMPGPFKIGAHWLYETAEKLAGTSAFSIAEQWFDVNAAARAIVDEEAEKVRRENPVNADGTPKTFKTVNFTDARGMWRDLASNPLIDDLLDQGAMSVIYGDSNQGKTFVALDMAYHIAAGQAWGEQEVERLPVLYIVAEGGGSIYRRIEALHLKHFPAGDAPNIPLEMLVHPIDLLHEKADLPALIATVRAFQRKFGLIVVDTLSRALAGGNENSPDDMGALVKHADRLRAATGAHLMFIHHSGKDQARGARGHSLLRAATDTEIEIAQSRIVVTKQRDMDGSFNRRFALEPVVLGVNKKGKPISSCTIAVSRVSATETVSLKDATASERIVLDAIGALVDLEAGEKGGVKPSHLVEYFKEGRNSMAESTVRSQLANLHKKGLISRIGRGLYKMSAAIENSECPETSIDLSKSVFE